jgi:hypothetical protein
MRDLMKNLIGIISLMVLLVSPSMAWPNTTDEIILCMEISKGAGAAEAHGMFADNAYHSGLLPYADYYQTITTSNEMIRLYNQMLEENFNSSVFNRMKMTEFNV